MVRESKKYEELRGFRTLFPDDLLIYKFISDSIEDVVKKWGYLPIEPPSLEYGEVLTAKGGLSPEQAKELFIFKDHDDRWIGLRFDLTTPIARIVGYNYESFVTKMPLRWYYFSKMWRYENDPKKGRYREFWQFGIELIGSSSHLADAETISIAIKSLLSLGFKPEQIKIFISHREILWGIISNFIEDQEKILEIIRLIDKKDKMTMEEIISKIKEIDENEELEKILSEILSLEPMEFQKLYDNFLVKIKDLNDKTKKAVENLNDLFNDLNIILNEYEMSFVLFDMSIARGFDYYTGIIYEVYIYKNNKRDGGSILGGGRYDRLIDLYGGLNTPSIGFALGVDRCVESMKELGIKIENLKNRPDAHIIVDISINEYLKSAFKISEILRNEGIVCTITLNKYSSWRKMLKSELEYADANKIPYTIIIDDSIKQGKVIYKDMNKRSQETIFIENIKNIFN